jgi:hypothetical protein
MTFDFLVAEPTIIFSEVAKANTPILLVFLSVFCVATMHEYYNMHQLSRLENMNKKFYVIQVYYFLRIP